MSQYKKITDPTAYALEKLAITDSHTDETNKTMPDTQTTEATSQIYNESEITFQKVGDLIKNIEPPEWLIEDYITVNTVSLMFAPPSCFKSFFAVDFAACIASGKSWHGHDVKQGAVFFIAGEGHSGLKRRFLAWSIANNIDLTDAPLLLSDGSTDLMNVNSRKALCEQIDAMIKEVGSPPALLIFDTLARNSSGNENDNSDMSRMISKVETIMKRYNCSALLVHHTGHNDCNRARGASSIKGGLDLEYQVKRDGESNLVTIQNTKLKDGEAPHRKTLEFCQVELGIYDAKGRPVTSGVLVDTDRQPSPEQKSTNLGKNEEIVWQAIRSRMAKDEPTEAAVIRDDLKAQGFDVSNFSRVRTSLLNKGLIKDDNGRLIPVNLND